MIPGINETIEQRYLIAHRTDTGGYKFWNGENFVEITEFLIAFKNKEKAEIELEKANLVLKETTIFPQAFIMGHREILKNHDK